MVVALQVTVCALWTIGPVLPSGASFQVGTLVHPLTITGGSLLFFGTLDASEMTPVALRNHRVCWMVVGATTSTTLGIDGEYLRAVWNLFFFWVGIAYHYGWLLAAMRERMRARFKGALGGHAQQYTSRLLQISSMQLALLVQGLSHGVSANNYGRTMAINTFSCSLVVAWVFGVAVFDASECNATRAARLRLSLREGAALAATGCYVLTGLAGYVIAEQENPDDETGTASSIGTSLSVVVAVVLIGRLVRDAKKQADARIHDMTSNPDANQSERAGPTYVCLGRGELTSGGSQERAET